MEFREKIMIKRKLPSYPLFVKDPYFSIWSEREELNGGNTVFWHGEDKPIYGTVTADGKEYVFLGKREDLRPLVQVSLQVKAFSTVYGFDCEDFSFEAEFVSPLVPNDFELMSCPVCFFRYRLSPKRKLDIVKIELYAEERLCYNTCYQENRREEVRGGVMRFETFESAYFGLLRQMPLSQSSDEFSADWGYYYLAAQDCAFTERDGNKFISAADGYENVEEPVSGNILIAFDDLISVYYFGEPLKGYYFRNGKTICDALRESYRNAASVYETCEEFDAALRKSAEPYGEDYLMLLYASLRQSIAAHKLVQDRKGRVLFLSKECNSDGCIATADVSYPSSPLFLLYAPELVRGMLEPIFDFARMPVWEFEFAPHDAGIYPYCIGQIYGALNQENKYNSDIYMRDWHKPENMPMLYLFPKGSKLYAPEKQMPVEECGNMLILSAAVALASGDTSFLCDNFDLLEKWAEYLCKFGFMPESQLCTDDFAEHLANNANLSIKAGFGIAGFAAVCEVLGKCELADKYMALARNHAKRWTECCFDGKNSTALTIGGDRSTYSLKYNLVFDKLFGTSLYPQELYRAETERYMRELKRFGTPLDSRASYTKSDWIVWAASLCSEMDGFTALISPIADYLRETPDRVPFADWYGAEDGKNQMFRNRSVQGGIFLPILLDCGKLRFPQRLVSEGKENGGRV